ncbi:MAG: hypothetical protein WCO51_12375, partial [bacterium]
TRLLTSLLLNSKAFYGRYAFLCRSNSTLSDNLLEDHLYWWLAYYHFARAHESLQIRMEEPVQRKGNQRPRLYKKVTPAMAAGLTSRRWSVKELISYPLL